MNVRGVIIEDEIHLASHLRTLLERVWPKLTVVDTAPDGPAGLALLEAERPDVAFVDIRMPGMNGLELVSRMTDACRRHCQVVFVTAYDEYAVQAFEQAAADYLLKPVTEARLEKAVVRLKERLARHGSMPDVQTLVRHLAQWAAPEAQAQTQRLRWIRAEQGQQARMISVDEVCYFQSDEKYTRVVTPRDEALIRLSLRELLAQLDPEAFWQVHRGTVVRVAAIDSWKRELTGGAKLRVKGREEIVSVSRAFAHLFKGM